MKKLIVLSGNSLRNKEWGEQCVEAYKDLFDEAEMLYYNHWESGAEFIDIPAEIEKLNVIVTKTPEAELYVIAKSIGTIVTLVAKQQGVINPVKAVFFGMPLDYATEEVFNGDFSPVTEFSTLVLAYHNDNDPKASFSFTQQQLREFAPYASLTTLHGDNHDYLDFADYRSDIQSFLAS